MKISEFKLKTLNGINGLIDTYFCGNDIKDKFINATLKIFVKQNINKYDDILMLFANADDEIDIADIERIKGFDLVTLTTIGRNFIFGKSEENSDQSNSEEESEDIPESTAQA